MPPNGRDDRRAGRGTDPRRQGGAQREVRSLGDLQRLVANGLPVRALDRTVEYVASSPREAVRLRDRLVPPATRKRRRQRLKPAESERVERLARVMALAEEVWESREDARQFLTTPTRSSTASDRSTCRRAS